MPFHLSLHLPYLMPFLTYLIQCVMQWFYARLPTPPFYRHPRNQHDPLGKDDIKCDDVETLFATACSRRKPEWVVHEVLRLKALIGKAGCRSVAITFNRLHGHGGGHASMGKSFVAQAIKRHQYQLACLRREIRNTPPFPVKVNAAWGLDLTFKADQLKQVHGILGMVDHGSRLVLCLTTLLNKRAWTLLGHLCLAIGKYGKPNAIRTDNEVIFNSFVFRTFLRLTGIKHQQTQVCAPWQNGRIERLFGTLKPLLKQLVIPDVGALQLALKEFTLFYNHVRPHQNLGDLTPAEVWQGMTVADLHNACHRPCYTCQHKVSPQLVQAMDGLLVGYYLRR